MTKVVRVSPSIGCWRIEFPDRVVIARDKTMVQNLVRAYAKNFNVNLVIDWGD